jgi:hypothetical protein
MITVVNKHTHKPTEYDWYIGRGSPLGNPFTSKPLANTKAQFQCKSREESVAKFKEYILEKIEKKDSVVCASLNYIYSMALKGDVNLICYCSPELCHGHIIKRIIEERLFSRQSNII